MKKLTAKGRAGLAKKDRTVATLGWLEGVQRRCARSSRRGRSNESRVSEKN
jgi:hypothetical protein